MASLSFFSERITIVQNLNCAGVRVDVGEEDGAGVLADDGIADTGGGVADFGRDDAREMRDWD